MIKKLTLLAVVGAVVLGSLMLLTYNIIKIDRVTFMEIQESFRPMEEPLPLPPLSIPIEGAVFVAGMGAPDNPIEADDISIARGQMLFDVNCALCHGTGGTGNGVVAPFLSVKTPADLTSEVVLDKSDGAIFVTITSGVPDTMPSLNENLTVRDRWDVVNFVRTLAPDGESK